VAADREIERVRKLALVLDGYMVDPLLGMFLPGIGDVLGSVIGLYIVAVAIKRKVSPLVIAHMLINLGLDTAFGVLPLIGDWLDFKFKANQRNANLLVARTAIGGRAHLRDWLFVGCAAGLFVAIAGGIVLAIVEIIRAL
jgi:hypothetical protein